MAWQHVRDLQVIGGPDWMDTEGFCISAKGDASATDEQCRGMVQSLLKERFRLGVHTGLKDLPVYALVVASGGPKFRESPPEAAPNVAFANGQFAVQKASMANVARVLSLHLWTDRCLERRLA